MVILRRHEFFTIWGMLDVTGFNEYNIKLYSVIGNDTRHIKY